jgi:hypothetical protein
VFRKTGPATPADVERLFRRTVATPDASDRDLTICTVEK